MAAPNIVGVTSIFGKTETGALTTSPADLLVNSASSGKVYKVNSLYVSNVDGTAAADATIGFFDDSKSAERKLANTIAVPADATLVVVSKEASIYLEEGDKITGLASATGDLEYIISFEEIS